MAASKAKDALKKGDGDAARFLAALDEPEAPKARRYVLNDATYEALGEVLADNPTGTLAFRDELVSLLKTLDREEFAAARGFFLTAWNGTAGYSFDRIIRGKTHIEAACISLLGSTQPGRLAEYMRRAIAGGAGDDGLIQRFSLLVWPDQSPEWREVDRYPNSDARAAAWGVFERLDKLDPDAIGAERDQFENVPFLRFDDAALGVFSEWRADLERRFVPPIWRRRWSRISRNIASWFRPWRLSIILWTKTAALLARLRLFAPWRSRNTSKPMPAAPMPPGRKPKRRPRKLSLRKSARAICRTDSRRETFIEGNGRTFPIGAMCKPASTY